MSDFVVTRHARGSAIMSGFFRLGAALSRAPNVCYGRRSIAVGAMDPKTPHVVSADEAKRIFNNSPESTKLLDTTWFMPAVPRDPKLEFSKRRLLNAQFWDLDEIASSHPLALKHMLPSGSQFQNACCEQCFVSGLFSVHIKSTAKLGIQRDHRVLL